MTNELDRKFFTLVESDPTSRLAAYSVTGHATVLKSMVNGKNLACVQFLYSDSRHEFPMVVQLRSEENRYQVLFPSDEESRDPRPFGVAITNLCRDGMIKIDIMKDDKQVDKVDDPERGLNQVNELHPLQSYLIEADQTNGNRRIMT